MSSTVEQETDDMVLTEVASVIEGSGVPDDAAKKAGVAYVVKMSAVDASPTSKSRFLRLHGVMEDALAKSFKPAVLEGLKLDASNFNSDIHADREYRANLVRVMAKRALGKLSGRK